MTVVQSVEAVVALRIEWLTLQGSHLLFPGACKDFLRSLHARRCCSPPARHNLFRKADPERLSSPKQGVTRVVGASVRGRDSVFIDASRRGITCVITGIGVVIRMWCVQDAQLPAEPVCSFLPAPSQHLQGWVQFLKSAKAASSPDGALPERQEQMASGLCAGDFSLLELGSLGRP